MLDGMADHDEYFVYTTGSQGPERNYVVNVLDTGIGGLDDLSIYGADDSRRHLPAAPHHRHPTASGTRWRPTRRSSTCSTATSPPSAAPTASRRRPTSSASTTTTRRGIDGLLSVFGLSGNDTIATDDTSSITLIDGGAGNDTFQIGQLFGLPRIVDDLPAPTCSRGRST